MDKNIAILILAHHNPKQLGLLISHLQTDFDLFIQIDKKSSINIDELPQYENVHYYKDIEVYWGEFSQVENMCSILNKAYNNKKYKNYLYISGDDLPIKSNSFITSFFETNPNKIYAYANPLPIKTWGFNHGFDRLDRYWFVKFKSRKFVKIFSRITLIVQRALFIKIKRFPIDYYAGSNWINLTLESVEYINTFIEQNPKFFKKLKYSRATDEIWAQTILMNSPLKQNVVNHDMRFINWEKGPDYPRTLDLSDYEDLINSKALFARKFNINKNKEVIEAIYNFTKQK